MNSPSEGAFDARIDPPNQLSIPLFFAAMIFIGKDGGLVAR